MKRGKKKKKKQNAKLQHHMTGPHVLLHELSAFIYIGQILATELDNNQYIYELGSSYIWCNFKQCYTIQYFLIGCEF